MKKSLLLIAIVTFCNISTGQNFSELSNYEFKTVESYKTEQAKVLSCANYLFNNPTNKDELNRLTSIQYIMKWMEGTPDYTFEIGSKAIELTKGNTDLLGLYFAAMSKVVLENEGDKLSSEDIYNQAEQILVDYCSKKENKVKPSKKIKKIIKSKKE
ncbi:hypothetical protein EYD45_10070 [Hyunsoonleella flava]|uniref:Uncharacterized protein n=1 Tax=Hyunsoonleella flava TaxID=2527939 RepID=A0A4Q9FEA3_9FLAO|nr:hypothetical protein [Hyunsoonleella flava]TBN03343.1 hypothetical protein EYD45_10070 [Hyunsoonleella flava]